MKKFSFSLESLLDLREWEEKRSRQTFGEASRKVARLETMVASLEGEKAALYQAWDERGQASFSRNERLALMGGVESMDFREKELEEALKEARKQREQALIEMTQAMRARKVVENLKTRRLEEYRAELYRQEAQEIEDAYNARRSERSEL